MLGIGALLQTSASALLVLKWVGGAYLVWLGVQLWRAPPLQLKPMRMRRFRAAASCFARGCWQRCPTPKALLFMALSCLSFSTRRAACGCSLR